MLIERNTVIANLASIWLGLKRQCVNISFLLTPKILSEEVLKTSSTLREKSLFFFNEDDF